MLCIMAGMDLKDCTALFGIFTWSVWTRSTVVLGGFAGDDTSRAVFLVVFAPKMLGILVDMDQKDSYGDVGKDCALALLGVVLEFIAECGSGADGKIALSLSWVWCSCSLPHVAAHHQGRLHLSFPLWQVFDGCAWFLGCRRGEDSRVHTWRRRSRSHSCSSLVAQCLDKVVLPVVVQDRGPDSACAVLGQGCLALCCARQEGVQTVQKPVKFPHAFLYMVVDISVVAQRQFPWAWLFSRP